MVIRRKWNSIQLGKKTVVGLGECEKKKKGKGKGENEGVACL